MKKRGLREYLVIAGLSAFVVIGLLIVGNHSLVGFAIFEDIVQGDFEEGTYSNTVYNSSGFVQLTSGESSGSYTSQVFNNSITSVWNNISWTSSAIGELPTEGLSETKFGSGNFNMEGVVALFHLNEENANSAPGGNDFEDKSGQDHHANESGGVTFATQGKLGNSVGFDGNDDAIILGDIEADNWEDIAISAWIKTSDTSNTQRIMGKDQVGVQGNFLFWFQGGGWKYQVLDEEGNWELASYTSTAPNDGQWHHMLGTTDNANNKIYLYVDGVEVAESTFSASTLDDGQNEEIVIGADSDVGAFEQVFNGNFDEIILFNRSLDANEVKDLYERGITQLNLSIRDCDDSLCDGENWTDISDNTSPQEFSLNNIYFQYRFMFETDDSDFTPELYNVSVDYSPSGPTVEIISPSDDEILDINTSLNLNFSIVNITALDICWYNLNGGENITLNDCQNTTFNASDGIYTLNMFVNDTYNHESSDSVNFRVIATGVVVNINQPTGTKTSRTNIPLEYDVSGNNLTCTYEIRFTTGTSVKSNTTLSNCSGTTFDVSTDGDYSAFIYLRNLMNVTNSTSSNFSVSTVSGNSVNNQDGGGGGGGGSSYVPVQNELEIGDLGDVIISPGEQKVLELNVKNTKNVVLNKCKIVSSDGFSDWIDYSGEIKNIYMGEIADFLFTLSVPEDATMSSVIDSVNLECVEDSFTIPLNLILIDSDLNIEITESVYESDDRLIVMYSAFSESDGWKDFNISLYDSMGNLLMVEEVSLEFDGENTLYKDVAFDVSSVDKGILKISVSEQGLIIEQSEFALGSTSAITGFAFVDQYLKGNFIYLIVGGLILLVAGLFIIKILKNYRKRRNVSKKYRRFL